MKLDQAKVCSSVALLIILCIKQSNTVSLYGTSYPSSYQGSYIGNITPAFFLVHDRATDALTLLGVYYQSRGNCQKSLEYFEQILKIKRELYGSTPHIDIAISLNYIGTLLESLGRYEGALQYYRESLAIYQKLYDTQAHPDVDRNDIDAKINSSNSQDMLQYYREILNAYRELRISNLSSSHKH
jgi:tetratricopeptide (TPR) repeat protein